MALVWFAMLGVDFLLNGAVFARMYQDGGAFLLPPAQAAARIPLGYLAFLLVAFGIVEVDCRLGIVGVAGGIRLGLVLGGLGGLVWALSLYSIASITAAEAGALAFVWFAAVFVGSAVAAAARARASVRRLALAVAGFDLGCFAIVVAAQSSGMVPTVTM
ncbi:MAG TPA: hypothetical protein VFR33_15330 [Candidatus Dormibacteraeota bacterium]|nr:hypothetical protein [Candidatus Dormibacteraeota bacterium]